MNSAIQTLHSVKHPILNGKKTYSKIQSSDLHSTIKKTDPDKASRKSDTVTYNKRSSAHLTNWILQNLGSDDPVLEGLPPLQSNTIHNEDPIIFHENVVVKEISKNYSINDDLNAAKSERNDQENTSDDQRKFDEFIASIRTCSNQINKTLHDIDEIGLTYSTEDLTTELTHMHMTLSSSIPSFTAAAISPTVTKELSVESFYSSPLVISNYGRFINDQCTRTLTTINGEYHMRQLSQHSESLVTELNEVDKAIDNRRKRGIDFKIDMPMGSKKPGSSHNSDSDRELGPAMHAQLNWLEDVHQLIQRVQEFVEHAFELHPSVQQVEEKCNKFKSLCLGKTRNVIHFERMLLMREIDALNSIIHSQMEEINRLETAMESKELEMKNQDEESEAAKQRIEFRFKPLFSKLQEAIEGENVKIAERTLVLNELNKKDALWNELLNELTEKRGNASENCKETALELVKDLLTEFKLEKGKDKFTEIQKSLQESTFEVSELSNALKNCDAEEVKVNEEIQQNTDKLESDTKMYREQLKELTLANEQLLAAIKVIEDANFERKRRSKKLSADRYRSQTFRIGNKVPSSATTDTASDSETAQSRVMQSREFNTQLSEESQSLFLLPMTATEAAGALSPNTLSKSEYFERNDVSKPTSSLSTVSFVMANENISLRSISSVGTMPQETDSINSSNLLCDKVTEELLQLTSNERKREQLLGNVKSSQHAKALNSHKVEDTAQAQSPRMKSRTIKTRKVMNKHQIDKVNEAQHQNDSLNSHSMICTAFYLNFLSIGEASDVDSLAKQHPSVHLSAAHYSETLAKDSNCYISNSATVFRRMRSAIRSHNTPYYTIRDGLTVLKGVCATLLKNRCIDLQVLTEIDRDISYISTGISFMRSETAGREEFRFRLHNCCTKLLSIVLNNGGYNCLIQNSKKMFAEIISCVLALVGVIIHCSLRGLIPWVRSRSPFQYVAVTEAVVSNMVQLISLQSKNNYFTAVDSKLGNNSTHSNAVIVQPKRLMGLLIEEVNSLHKTTMNDRSDNTNNAITNLLDSIRSLIKSSIAQGLKRNDQFSFSLQDRNALFSLQLVLLTLFSESDVDNNELQNKFNQIISNAESDVFGIKKSSEATDDSPVISSDIDELLLLVCPQVIPAILSCHLLRQVIERDLKRSRFVQNLQSSSQNVSDLQFLNMNLPEEVDLAVTKHHIHQQQQQQLNQQEEQVLLYASDKLPTNADPSMNPEEITIRPKSRIDIESPSLLPAEYPSDDGSTVSKTAVDPPKHEDKDVVRNITKTKKILKKAAPVRKGLHSVIIAPPSDTVKEPSPTRKVRIEAKVTTENVSTSRLNLDSPTDSRLQRGQTEPLKHASNLPSNLSIQNSNANAVKSSKHVHLKWIMDMEMYMQTISKKLFQVIKPYAFNPPPILDRIIQSVSALTLSTGLKDTNNSEKQTILRFPLPSSLAYRILNHIDNIRVLVMGHHSDGEQRIQDTTSEFIEIMNELRKTKDKVFNVVAALAWPMKKKLDWLKIKYKVVANELLIVKRNLADVQSVIDSLVDEREDAHRSLLSIARDKKRHLKNSTGSSSPKRAIKRNIFMQNHSAAMQQFIEDHVTLESLAALKILQATEEELSKVTATLQFQFERAEKANDKLEDAYNVLIASRSITEDDSLTTIDMLSHQHSVGSTDLQELINNSTFGGHSLYAQDDEEVKFQPLSAPHTQSDYAADTSFTPDPFLHQLNNVNKSHHHEHQSNNININDSDNNNNINISNKHISSIDINSNNNKIKINNSNNINNISINKNNSNKNNNKHIKINNNIKVANNSTSSDDDAEAKYFTSTMTPRHKPGDNLIAPLLISPVPTSPHQVDLSSSPKQIKFPGKIQSPLSVSLPVPVPYRRIVATDLKEPAPKFVVKNSSPLRQKSAQEKKLEALPIKTLAFAEHIIYGLQLMDPEIPLPVIDNDQSLLKAKGDFSLENMLKNDSESDLDVDDAEDEKENELPLITIADCNSWPQNSRSTATKVTLSFINNAVLRVINTRDDLQLAKELEHEMAELQQFDELVEKEIKQTMLTIASLNHSPATEHPHHHNNGLQQHRIKAIQHIKKKSFHFDPTMRIAGQAALRKFPHHRFYFIKGDRSHDSNLGLGLDDVKLQTDWDPTALNTSESFSSDDDREITIHSRSHPSNTHNADHNALVVANESLAVDVDLTTNISNSPMTSIVSAPPNYPKPSTPFKSPSRKFLNKS